MHLLPTIESKEEEEEEESPDPKPLRQSQPNSFHQRSISQSIGDVFDKLGLYRKLKHSSTSKGDNSKSVL